MAEPQKSRGPFIVAVLLVIAGLVGFALYRAGILAPTGTDETKPATLTDEEMKKLQQPKTDDKAVEAPDAAAPTTLKEYTFVPEEKLPPVQGVAGYKPLKDNTVKMALNVWAGWAPVIYANGGMKPKREWVTKDGKKFKLELVLIDDPVAMRDAYASGNVHIGWATLDMLPLFMEELKKDSRTNPRVYQQIDWSNGGDGIVARDGITNVGQLRGKTIVLAQNSPSQYFVLNALINGGVQPSEVTFKYTSNAFEAAAAFNADKKIAACVSWAPDIYNLSKVPGNKLIVSTLEANRLIADVWFARADFAKDHGPFLESLVKGILDATEELYDDQAKKQEAAKLMGEGYNLPPADALAMLGDAHWTNFAENFEFFLNQNNPTNFERTWDTAYYLYGRVGRVGQKVPWDQVADFSIIKRLASDAKYSKHQNRYQTQFAAKSVSMIKAESGEILTKTVVIHFFPNSADLKAKLKKNVGGKEVEELYDPNVDFVVEEVGKMAGQYGAARIVIEGHTDGSMKGQIPFDAVKILSDARAKAVRDALIKKFPKTDPNQIAAEGMGWQRPADESDPNNHAKNRRVEVKVFPLEAK